MAKLGHRQSTRLVAAVPPKPPLWLTAVNAVFTAWGANPPATLIDKGNGAGYDTRVPAFAARVVSSGWTDFNKVQRP